MREFGFGIALAAMLVAVDAPAAVVVTLGGTSDGTRGLVSSVDNTQTIDFDSVTTLVGITYSSSRGSLSLVSGDVAGKYKSPDFDTSRYLSVGSFGPEAVEVELAEENTYFGLQWGSVDFYNRIYFFDGSTMVAGFSGTSIEGLSSGDFVNFAFTGGDAYDRIVLLSLTPAFETDNHAFAAATVPAPAALPLLLSGIAALGCLARRHRV